MLTARTTVWAGSLLAVMAMATAATTADPPATQPTSQPDQPPATQPAEPAPAPTFDTEGSDAKAIELADATVVAMGGQAGLSRVRFLSFRFFGTRFHAVDLKTGAYRMETITFEGEHQVVLMNLQTGTGRVWTNGWEMKHEGIRDDLLAGARRSWANDSYWLLMPFKLKDPGVTLKYVGEGQTAGGEPAEIIDVTFTAVGDTPGNRYLVYIDPTTKLVNQWDFFRNRDDETAELRNGWTGWKWHGPIRLSSRRDSPPDLGQLGVFDSLPSNVFTDPGPIDPKKWGHLRTKPEHAPGGGQ